MEELREKIEFKFTNDSFVFCESIVKKNLDSYLESEKSGMIESDHGEALEEDAARDKEKAHGEAIEENKAFDEAKAAKAAEEEAKRKAEIAELDRLQAKEDAEKAAEILEKIKGGGGEIANTGDEKIEDVSKHKQSEKSVRDKAREMLEKTRIKLEIRKILKDLTEKEREQYIVVNSKRENSYEEREENMKLDQIRKDRQYANDLNDLKMQDYAREFSDYSAERLKQEESNAIRQRDEIIYEERGGQRKKETQEKLNILMSKIGGLYVARAGGLDKVIASFKDQLERKKDKNFEILVYK